MIVDTLVGTTLGGYTLKRLLGSGGMGAVYLAEDPAIGQQVAIKIVRTDGGDYSDGQNEEQTAERFRQEARAVAGLDHLHVLPLYRYGEEETIHGRRAYMIMQYRPEGSLFDWLRKRAGVGVSGPKSLVSQPEQPTGLPDSWPLGIEEAAEYLRQAASALQYAHERGIVHRDVKPANFLLRFDLNQANGAFLLLSDFGLAKLYSASSATSSVFGTPTYMAPEQFEGAAVPESDQYALAVMIYYLLAGRPPFEGEPIRLMHQHLNMEPPPIRMFVPTLSAGVEGVLTRALAKKPGARYPSIETFAEAFTQRLYEPTRARQFSLPSTDQRSERAGQMPPNSPMPFNLAQSQVPQAPSPYAAPTAFQPTPAQPDAALTPTVFSAAERTPSGPTQIRLSDPSMQQGQYANSPYMTPSQNMAQTHYMTPQQASSPGAMGTSTERPVSRRSALGWILGGAAVLAVGGGAYIYTNQAGSKQNPSGIPTGQTPSNSNILYTLKGHTGIVNSVAWSADGTQLVSASEDGSARIWNPGQQASALHKYTGHSQAVRTVAWNPKDGTQIATGGRDRTVQVWNTSGTLTHGPFNLSAIVSDIAWRSSGTVLFASTLGNGVHEVLVSDNKVAPSIARTSIATVAVSPEGNYIAVGTQGGAVSIYQLPITRKSTPVFLPYNHVGPVLALAWSPDSTQLASSGGLDKSIKVLNITSRNQTTIENKSVVRGIAWEPGSTGRFAIASSDGALRVLSADHSKVTSYTGGHKGVATAVAWGTNGVATGSTDTTIVIWRVS